MKQFVTIILFVLITFFVNTIAKEHSKQLQASRSNNEIKIDGELSEIVWNGTPISGFTQREPEEGIPSTEQTKVWLAYDNDAIYIAAKLYDSVPEQIDRNLARRDSWMDSDWFIFFVDPYLDKKTGYFFAVNPGGSIMDGTYFNDSWNDDSWDGLWTVDVNVDEEGWNVEMRIPFSQLRFNEADKMTWGINFERDIKRIKEESYYVMVPKNESGFVSHFAELNGLNGIKPKQRFEIIPYLVQRAQYLRHEAGDPFYKSSQYKTNIGADIKIGIGSNLNIDATINPDFGQVEVDPAVVNLSAFETFFPEKRNFFIEGSNIFQFGYGGSQSHWGFNFGVPNLFYSRRIGKAPQASLPDYDFVRLPNETRILGAAKITGKIGESFSVGMLSTFTERTFATLKSNDKSFNTEIEPLTHYGTVRTQKEFGDGMQGLGMIFTSVNRDLRNISLRDQYSDQAYILGVDGWTFLDEEQEYVITGNVVGSYTHGTKQYITDLQTRPYRYLQRPDATVALLDENKTSLTGFYSRVLLNKQKGNFILNTAIGAVSPGFEFNDLGFQWFGNKINGHFGLGYNWFDPDPIFRSKTIVAAHFRDYDFEGNSLNNGIWFGGWFQFLNYYNLELRGSYNFEDLSRKLTRGGPLAMDPSQYYLQVSASTDSREIIIFSLNGNHWEDAIGSNGASIGLDLTWKPNTQINFSIGPSYTTNYEKRQWVDNIDDLTATKTYNTRYVFGEIDQETVSANIRLNWTFTPTLTLQLFVQPFISVGKYNNYKELAAPRSLNYNTYGENGSSIEYDEENDEYVIDPDGAGDVNTFTISNPNFNFKSLRGNLVLRYEIMPGTLLYIVWSHDKINDDHAGEFNLKRDFINLVNSESNDIFLVKFTHWFGI